MLILILLTFFVFFVFWLGDLYITKKTIDKTGIKAELNPLMRTVLRVRRRFIWVFKIIEIGLFLYLLIFLTTIGSGMIPFYILLFYIFFYSILVANNSRVYYKVTNKETVAFSYIFICVSILLILFIYLNYMMYSGLTMTYNEFRKCQTDYKKLNWECYKNESTVQPSSELKDILGDLNILIPRP
jgi:hypothetical protein